MSIETDVQAAVAEVIAYYESLIAKAPSLSSIWGYVVSAVATLINLFKGAGVTAQSDIESLVTEAMGTLLSAVVTAVKNDPALQSLLSTFGETLITDLFDSFVSGTITSITNVFSGNPVSADKPRITVTVTGTSSRTIVPY